MKPVEIVSTLAAIQTGQLDDKEVEARYRRLKREASLYLRAGQVMPLCLAWYVTLMIEDGATEGHQFLTVRDPLLQKGSNRQEASFALAWSYLHVKSMTPTERLKRYGFGQTYAVMDHYYSVSQNVVRNSVKRYGQLVEDLENKEVFSTTSIAPDLSRYAMEQIYLYEDDDTEHEKFVQFEASLEDGTLIQYFRDGHYRALLPPKHLNGKRRLGFASYKDRDKPRHLDTRITYLRI